MSCSVFVAVRGGDERVVFGHPALHPGQQLPAALGQEDGHARQGHGDAYRISQHDLVT
ncbi:hypothetical protein [Nonomuraea africana]|uniref:Uncharacterized protein n=1 Tax=Nonomuraea africana TaxID=46171 RepID=A0ABR9KJY7_9ACTN|nr:hypothetical protein [Nonomuraea africana]MBE1562329.1 hypothetical protein [Nonomuraea africana]